MDIKKPELDQKSDEELMVLYQNGDALAFDILYSRYVTKVLNFLNMKTGSEKKAQDLAQEVFLKLHRSKAHYNKMLPFAPWVFSITRSVFLDAAKRRNLEDSVIPEELDKFQSPQSLHSTGVDLAVLNTLPDHQRQVVNFRVIDEATFDEIAEKLSMTPENARQIFSRAMKKLKSTFAGKE